MNVLQRLVTINLLFFLVLFLGSILAKVSNVKSSSSVEEISDIKDFKKLLRTKNNVLVLFISTMKRANNVVKMFREAADVVKGQGTMVLVDCYGEVARKTCKKLKITPEPFIMKHYKDGEFHRDYDRMLSIISIVSFMRDPTGDAPWEEDATAADIVHVPDMPVSANDLFVAGKLAAVDTTKETALGTRFSIKGYPTVKYFKDGAFAFDANVRDADRIVAFMQEPKEPPPPPPPEAPWHEEKSEVVHLDEENFKPFLKKKKHVLVMFYAPWCGHCKKAKPEFAAAAEQFKEDSKVEFAAVDCTTHQSLCSVNEIKGYPTIKYFHYYTKETQAYSGGRTNPPAASTPAPSNPQAEWAGLKGADSILHLTEANFSSELEQKDNVLVMFYAPWCGHCKAMKNDYALAAEKVKQQLEGSFLAAVDATVQQGLQREHGVRGFPTLKLFRRGKFVADYDRARKADDLFSFMKNPPSGGKDEL
ncbi:hypothetical protein B566_EDAN003054 [Ephemera danica]|nr:hypothetical protein B566_EDAN003054 [Ephemera danica]